MILLYLACLFPLAVYLLILAVLNRGPQPAVVTGPWDGAGLLLAISGFLIFGGPAVLNGFYEQARVAAIMDPSRLTFLAAALRPLGQLPWAVWVAAWFAYFLVSAVGAAVLLWKRQDTLAVYNLTAAGLTTVLGQVRDRLGLELTQSGPVISFQRPGDAECATLEVSAWPFARHVTLHWRDNPPLRELIDAEMARALAEVNSGSSPLSSWLLGLAGGFLVSLFFGLVIYVVLLVRLLLHF